jgi:5-methylcytosine-specific restriction endonuclease McrA
MGEQSTRKCKGTKKPSAAQVWAEIEDRFVPTFAPWPSERVVYLRLLRQTRLAGRATIRVSLQAFAEALRISVSSLRKAYKRLEGKGAIQIQERGYAGHLIRVFLPSELRGIGRSESLRLRQDVEAVNFYSRTNLRELIYSREKHRCFYCGRKLKASCRGMDHVVPRSQGGDNSYRNVVACCLECNSLKGERAAEKFVKVLGNFQVLTRTEQKQRLAALTALRHGQLKPSFGALRHLRIAA